MPKISKIALSQEPVIHIGIDPGANGGLAAVCRGRSLWEIKAISMPVTEKDIWEWFASFSSKGIAAVIERQLPRPTTWQSKQGWRSSILKSTCLLYGNYMQLRMALMATGISFEDVTPQQWQKTLGIPRKGKDETNTKWKNRLKAKAQQLFPDVKVTLKIADALLIAEYCRKWRPTWY